jgi:hypothetical protein
MSNYCLWHYAKWDGTCDVEGVIALVGVLGWGSVAVLLFRVGSEAH